MLRIRLQGDPFGSHQVAVVVVVPARHRVDYRVVRLDQCPVGRVDHGPGAARDHDALQRDFDLQPVAPELPYRFAQAQHAVARGVVRLSGGQGAQRSVPEAVRDGKLARQEIAHREIRDLLPRGDGRAYLGGDAEDLQFAHQYQRKKGPFEEHAFLLRAAPGATPSLSDEHIGYRWVPPQEARAAVRWPAQARALDLALQAF